MRFVFLPFWALIVSTVAVAGPEKRLHPNMKGVIEVK